MATRELKTPAPRAGEGRDVDRHVGARIRARRAALGLTQQALAGLIGVTYQQAHKYETGINRISAGRLFAVAQALGVGTAHFYEGLPAARGPPPPDARRRMLLQLARDVAAIPSRARREAVCNMARVMAASGGRGEGE